ncbi:MAG: SMC-Scp complex subunit ScpB [Burkholderiales bacterium]
MSSQIDEAQPEEAVADAIAQPPDTGLAKRILEAALLSAQDPVSIIDMKKMFESSMSNDELRKLLDDLREEWSDRSIELVQVASGWRFRVKPEFQPYLGRMSNEKPPRYSRAVMETLAIIAYRQPVTRADIESIRGVQVSPHILKSLEARGWIDQIGTREVVGRPAIFGTTKKFLDDLNLKSLEELPPLDQLQMSLDMNQGDAPVATPTLQDQIQQFEQPAANLPGEGAPADPANDGQHGELLH